MRDRRSKCFLVAFIGLWMAAAVAPAVARACPGCKEAAFDDPLEAERAQSTAKGYGMAIGVMLLVPVSLISGIAFQIARSASLAKSRLRQQQSV